MMGLSFHLLRLHMIDRVFNMGNQTTLSIMQKLPRLFTYADTSKFTGNANVFLTRALKAGYVTRLTKGSYFNSLMYRDQLPTVEEVACFVRQPTYISCEWAMNYHGLLLQVPVICTAVTLHSTFGARNTIRYGNHVIEYSSISNKLFFGFETKDGISIATPEKALLDAVYLRKYIPFGNELEAVIIDPGKLLEAAARFPSTVSALVKSLVESNQVSDHHPASHPHPRP